MGYYTLHKIRIINKYNTTRNLQRLIDVIEEVTKYTFRLDDYSYLIDDDWNSGYGTKWYTFHDDIYVISKKLPKLKILVEAKEENGNTWEVIVQGGHTSSYYSRDDESDNESDESSEMLEEEDENTDENEEEEEEENNLIIEEEFEDINENDSIEKFQR